MEEIKKQRYVVKAGQGDCHYFYPYTTDKKMIEKNIDEAWRDCFIADFGRISGVVVQDPTGFTSTEGYMVYEGDMVVFQKDEFHQLCEIVKKEDSFYGLYKDEEDVEQSLLMNDGYIYDFEEEEPDYYDDYYDENKCFCCECCGCTCYLEDYDE